jgi:hypothetical protein
MAFKCGHCGEKHDTVKEAQQCFRAKKIGPRPGSGINYAAAERTKMQSNIEEQSGQHTEQVTYEFLSMGQQKFLGDLLRQFGLVLASGQDINKISYADGKKILAGLIDARRLKATNQPYSLPDGVLHDPQAKNMPGKVRQPTRQRLPDCAPGYYAVPDWTGKEELKFFWVKVKKGTGPYAGWTFIDQVVGGHADAPCKGKFAVDAINAILDFGPDDAGILFADKFKHCYKCNRSLTKKASRILSMGRYCAYQNGKGEEWDALNTTYNDADAED